MGERSPHNNPNLRSLFVGMSMDTTRSDMTQAVLEGVAFAVRDSVEVAKSLGIDVKRSTICGGGAKSELWCRIMANVLNMEIVTLEKEEGPAYGGAILAAVGCGEYRDVSEAADKLVKSNKIYSPDGDIVAKYESRYKKFKEIYLSVKRLFE